MSIDTEKGFDKVQHLCMIKALSKVSLERRYLNIFKALYDKPTATIIFNAEKQ